MYVRVSFTLDDITAFHWFLDDVFVLFEPLEHKCH